MTSQPVPQVESMGAMVSPVVESLLERELAEVEAALGPHHWATHRHRLTCAHYHAGVLRALAAQQGRVAPGRAAADLIPRSLRKMTEQCDQVMRLV